MHRDTTSWAIPVLLAVAVAAGVWYHWSNTAEQNTVSPDVQTPPSVTTLESIPRSEPLYPILDKQTERSQRDLRPLPALSESDEYFKLELTDLFGESVGALIAGSRLIERVVNTVDNLPRAHVAERMRPVSALTETFIADPEGGDLYAISARSYRRYEPFVAILEASDIDELASLYRRYYPLFQKTYVGLGYPHGYFNDRLVETIDDMLATPERRGKILLLRPHVLYEFEDADLESRSAGQKLLLRMGFDNAEIVKTKLQQLHDAITSTSQ